MGKTTKTIEKYWKKLDKNDPKHLLLLVVGGFIFLWLLLLVLKVLLIPALIVGLIYVVIKWQKKQEKK